MSCQHTVKVNELASYIKSDFRVYNCHIYPTYSDVNIGNDARDSTRDKSKQFRYTSVDDLVNSLYNSRDKDGYRGTIIHGYSKFLEGQIFLKGVPDITEMEQKIEEAKMWSDTNPNSKKKITKKSWCIYVNWKC